jgi:MbtH protein
VASPSGPFLAALTLAEAPPMCDAALWGQTSQEKPRMSIFDSDDAVFNVVVNHEEQYSIWPVERELPPGWRAVGKSGPKQECLAYIQETWTDMRPLSLRKKMEEAGKAAG